MKSTAPAKLRPDGRPNPAGNPTGSDVLMESIYRRRIRWIYQTLVSPGLSVLEIGCGPGDLLASLKPVRGVGVDFSAEMIGLAANLHPDLEFILAEPQAINLKETFDCIIISDLIHALWDAQGFFERIKPLTRPGTRIFLNSSTRLGSCLSLISEKAGFSPPAERRNRLGLADISNLLYLSGFETIRHWPEVLWTGRPEFLADFLNRRLVKFFPFKFLALTSFIVSRPIPSPEQKKQPTLSVIVPARNEAGNIREIMARVPEIGGSTEIIFVEGHSTDNTCAVIDEAIRDFPSRDIKLFKQPGEGKGDAVRLGFARARGDILTILDADLTVQPEDLSRFYQALVSGKGDFVNGVRLAYPLEKGSMRFFNLLGNRLFGLIFTWLIGQHIKEALCGTKALWKADYERIAANRLYFGDLDPFGDFDLLFGAARLNLKIVEIPVRYKPRTYGRTNISRWKHGWLLLKMTLLALKKIKLI